MSDLMIAYRDRQARQSPARATSVARLSFGAAWVMIGVAGISAVAAAAIYLPMPHGRSIFATESRATFALPTPDEDFAVTWEVRGQRVELAALGPRAGQDSAWMPDGGMSTLLATRFPHAGRVRLQDTEIAITLPLPTPRPDITGRQDVAKLEPSRPGTVRTMPVEPQLAMLPPQQKPGELGIFDKLFADPDRNAKAVIAANPKTAVYDITKKAVFLPDGEKLEAHSGFGEFMDDPESMHRKNIGVTPPNVYAVSYREKPFHGVRALRMKPVSGGPMYGRDGFLTHSFLLGANGQSNGCISLKDYDAFLKAYEDGKFNQIIVVRSVDEPLPSMVASNQGNGT